MGCIGAYTGAVPVYYMYKKLNNLVQLGTILSACKMPLYDDHVLDVEMERVF